MTTQYQSGRIKSPYIPFFCLLLRPAKLTHLAGYFYKTYNT